MILNLHTFHLDSLFRSENKITKVARTWNLKVHFLPKTLLDSFHAHGRFVWGQLALVLLSIYQWKHCRRESGGSHARENSFHWAGERSSSLIKLAERRIEGWFNKIPACEPNRLAWPGPELLKVARISQIAQSVLFQGGELKRLRLEAIFNADISVSYRCFFTFLFLLFFNVSCLYRD